MRRVHPAPREKAVSINRSGVAKPGRGKRQTAIAPMPVPDGAEMNGMPVVMSTMSMLSDNAAIMRVVNAAVTALIMAVMPAAISRLG